MPFTTLAEGNNRKILFWSEEQPEGNLEACQAAAFESCPHIKSKDIAKLLRLFAVFIETGNYPPSKEKFKKVEKEEGLFAFKAHQMRMLGTILDSDTFGVCYCTQKQKDKYRRGVLSTAQAKKAEMLKEWGHHE